MKTNTTLLFTILFSVMRLSGEDILTPIQAEAEKKEVNAILKRMYEGEFQALSELDKQRPTVAIPILMRYTLDKSTNPQRAEIARVTLAKMPGLEDYFRPMLVVPPKEDYRVFCQRVDAFDVLARLKTKEAIRMIASSLFDEAVMHPDLPEDVRDGGPVKLLAAMNLGKMNLPDAPTTKIWQSYTLEDVELWRAWWTANKDKYQKE